MNDFEIIHSHLTIKFAVPEGLNNKWFVKACHDQQLFVNTYAKTWPGIKNRQIFDWSVWFYRRHTPHIKIRMMYLRSTVLRKHEWHVITKIRPKAFCVRMEMIYSIYSRTNRNISPPKGNFDRNGVFENLESILCIQHN